MPASRVVDDYDQSARGDRAFLRIAERIVVAAGYNAGEADQLRRSMSAWKRRGNMDHDHDKIIRSMLANG